MEYYKLLQLKREPFSNSPDPEYFFLSSRHQECMQKLELALRLKRGLNVVIGDVGTGKTTLCRELIRRFAAESDIETHLILDPSFNTADDFLRLLYTMFHDKEPAPGMSTMTVKEHIQHALFVKGVDRQRTTVLIIDEGQKISSACVEILRELLNFETNQFKLLQIVIFAQLEFQAILRTHANFADRINLLHHLEPMDFNDTRRMIHHRLKLSSTTARPREMFTWPAMWAIYRSTQGYPRKIIHLCHQSVLTMLIQNRTRAGWALIRSCKQRMIQKERRWPRRVAIGGAVIASILLLIGLLPQYLSYDASSPLAPLFKIPAPPRTVILPEAPPSPALGAMEIAPLPTVPDQPAPGLALESKERPTPSVSEVTIPPAITAKTTEPTTPTSVVAEPTRTNAVPAEPPTMLGELAVRQGDTLIHLVRLVYGSAENRCMRSVLAANPQIQNPDTIHLDDAVAFPVVVFQWEDLQLQKYRVVLDELDTLTAARAKLMAMAPSVQTPLRLFCYWTAGAGSRFQLAVARQFDAPRNAQEWMAALPESLAAMASVRSGWPEGALLLSNPLMERPH